MINPGSINIQHYDYPLPQDRIAKFPLKQREQSRLLVYQDGHIIDSFYNNIDYHIPKDSLLVLNNTKVIPARILFKKPTGGVIEIFCLEPYSHAEVDTAIQQTGSVKWRCLIGGASKWKNGHVLRKKVQKEKELTLTISFISKEEDHFVIQFDWTPNHYSFAEILYITGEIPLPPYLHRDAVPADQDRYQTVYAKQAGSVAAPTAGLHFTDEIIGKLSDKKITIREITLHVGAGTFMPVKTDLLQDHFMHAEWIRVSRSVIEEVKKNLKNNIVATGTTSLRTLETLYWIGVKLNSNKNFSEEQLLVEQWEPYKNRNEMEPEAALELISEWLENKKLNELITKTQILIAPGYTFRVVNALITNFHQPKSTLLLLIAAFIGDDWKKVYEHALQEQFRFLSYGDGSLLFRNNRLL